MDGFRHTNIPVKALFFSLTGTSLEYFRVYFYIQFFHGFIDELSMSDLYII